MDARTGIWAAKKLLVSFSKNAPTSIGMRAFVDKFVPKLRERYPHLEIEVQEKNTRYPHLVGVLRQRAGEANRRKEAGSARDHELRGAANRAMGGHEREPQWQARQDKDAVSNRALDAPSQIASRL